jgi:hypothetical protein
MNDIFLSYDRSDRAIAQRFADALEARGWSVWWDREIPLGGDFGTVIEQMLESARCVIVLWSSSSVLSRWVKTEAAAAADKDLLAPVFIEQHVLLPLEFRRIQAAELWDWNGDANHPEFRRLLDAVEQITGRPAAVPQQSPPKPASPGLRPSAPRRSLSLKFILPIAAAILIAAIALKFSRSDSDPPDGGNATPGASQASMPAGSPAGAPSAPPKDAIRVNIGDRIEDGKPAGAGKIESPYQTDTYVFQAREGQSVYFRMLKSGTGMSYIKWRLVDDRDMKIFDTCLGCTEPGLLTLARSGNYIMTVGSSDDPATGTYQLQLFDVPPPQKFTLKIGDAVKVNTPGPGAGAIENPGAADVYTFNAAAGQRVYFRKAEHSEGMAYMKWRLVDSNEMQVFDACLACTEPGAITLVRGGEYTLTVGHRTDASSGTYRLQLFNVPATPEIPIRIGDRIGPGRPVPGAGVIESPGSEDVYVFNAAPGEEIFFRLLNHGEGTDYLKWRLSDENGVDAFDACFGCSQPGRKTLTRGGKYTLTVGHPGNPSTGTYSFEIGK